MQISRRTLLAGGSALAVGAVATACAPGSGTSSQPSAGQTLSPVSKDVGTEAVTLTVWDQNTDGGISKAQEQLNAAFQQKYPNVKIERVSRSFADLKTTLKLALSGDNPPDVVQANQGYPDMGAFVKAGYLRPVNDYAELYGWASYYPKSLLALNSFSADGKTWQGDQLYGVSQTGELVGVYYNKAVLADAGVTAPPKTLPELTDAMAKVKAAGGLPLAYGDVEKSPGIHLYGVVISALGGRPKVNDLVTSASGAWTDPECVEAAATIQDWQDKGYITEGANGVSREAAVATFGKGGAAFLITGTWYQATLEEAPKAADIAFTALTPEGGATPVTMGGEGLAWAMTTKAGKPDAAAAYIAFITDVEASRTLLKTGNLPTVVPEGEKGGSALATDIIDRYTEISKADGITPYLDYATPTFYDTLSAAMQDLVAGKVTPQEYTKKLQDDYADFAKDR